MQRKQRTTIITYANIKKEVDSQLNPNVKKKLYFGLLKCTSYLKCAIKNYVMQIFIIFHPLTCFLKKTAEKTAKGGDKNFSLTTFRYKDWNEVKHKKLPYFTICKRYSDDQM